MEYELPSEQELIDEIKIAAAQASQRSGKVIATFFNNLTGGIIKNRNVKAVFRKAKKAGYEARLGLDIEITLLARLEKIPNKSTRTSGSGRPPKITYTTEDRKFFEDCKIVPPDSNNLEPGKAPDK